VEEPRRSRTRPCPLCGRQAQAAWFPFCSEHCRLIDLSHWLDESYAIPAETPAPGDDGAEGEKEA
jgi:endogenous inhibitor of DNA gyrase (YacG/DUF329 family)